MTDVVDVPATFDSLLVQISTKFDQAEAVDVIHERKRLYPARDSFDQTELYGALKQLNALGEIDEHGDQKVLEILAEKTSKKEEIIELLIDNKEASSPPRKDDFVGRDADVSSIIKLLTNPRVPGVNVFGDSGVGKTTLAKEVSKKLAEKHFEPFIIDLRGTKDTNAVYYKVLETFMLTPWDFIVSTAMKIAAISSDYDAELDIEMLATYKIITAQDVNGDRKYDLHTLFKEFVTSYLCKDPHSLMVSVQSDDVKEITRVAMLFEQFMSVKERRKLFDEWAKIVEKKESWLSSIYFRCLQSIQLADMEGTQQALKRAEVSLAKAMLLLTPEQVKAAKGLYKYCSGRIKCMTSANLIDESSKMEKERLLEQARFDLEEALTMHEKICGDHTLTARTLSHNGNCYMESGKPKEALTFYQRAMDMTTKLVGSEKHFDIPIYYNQLSQAYEALSKQETSWSFQSIAFRYLEKALSLQEELGVNDKDDTATFQRNLANILIGLGKYDQALEYAEKSSKIRKANLGEHPETVRILYLTGIIHEWRKDHKSALQSYEEAFRMEESLPEDNHSVVRKLLCGRLEVMCKKLNKKDKLGEYRPRMDKIRKETDALAGKETDADVEEETDVIKLDDKGGYYDFSSDYFFLEVPPNAVKMPVKVKYKVDICRCQPPMAGITTSVSYFLEMSSSLTEELSEPITVTLMHSGPGKEYGYNTTVMAFDQHKYAWEELKEVKQETRVSDLEGFETDFIQVQISKPTILAVVTRLIAGRFQVTPKRCVVRSSVCDVTGVEGTMKACFVCPTIMDEIPPYNRPDQTDDVYKMTSYPRGVAIVVNIELFENRTLDRVGSSKDKEDVIRLFQHLHFIVETIDKTTGDDLLAELHRISTNDFSECGCFILCIMSHGTNDSIYSSDGKELMCSLIVSLFRKSKSLAGKPKLFFFQACRGKMEDQGIIPADAQVDGVKTATTDSMQATSESNAVPKTADVLEFYSSYKGFASYRNSETGSPFIQSIVEVFRKYACRHHILELITKVKKRVSEDKNSGKKQMPHHNATLTKLLYFWPGIEL